MGHKKKGRYGISQKHGNQYRQTQFHGKKRNSTGMRMLLVFSIVAVVAIAWIFLVKPNLSSQPGTELTPTYPDNVAGAVYNSPIIASDGTRASLPSSFVNTSKLVFVDLKLQTQTSELSYQGRTIPLAYYRNGEYLPLVIISTPQQKVITGIRVCEPCGSFSFHIVEGKYLQCDACGTRWDIETLQGVSGGCPEYPPPKLPAAIGDNVDIDLSPLQLEMAT